MTRFDTIRQALVRFMDTSPRPLGPDRMAKAIEDAIAQQEEAEFAKRPELIDRPELFARLFARLTARLAIALDKADAESIPPAPAVPEGTTLLHNLRDAQLALAAATSLEDVLDLCVSGTADLDTITAQVAQWLLDAHVEINRAVEEARDLYGTQAVVNASEHLQREHDLPTPDAPPAFLADLQPTVKAENVTVRPARPGVFPPVEIIRPQGPHLFGGLIYTPQCDCPEAAAPPLRIDVTGGPAFTPRQHAADVCDCDGL